MEWRYNFGRDRTRDWGGLGGAGQVEKRIDYVPKRIREGRSAERYWTIEGRRPFEFHADRKVVEARWRSLRTEP